MLTIFERLITPLTDVITARESQPQGPTEQLITELLKAFRDLCTEMPIETPDVTVVDYA
jgi:hypothetical protein